jgi:hypothetical protein
VGPHSGIEPHDESTDGVHVSWPTLPAGREDAPNFIAMVQSIAIENALPAPFWQPGARPSGDSPGVFRFRKCFVNVNYVQRRGWRFG